ncbi:hypothetical protein SEA_MOAB_253 [Streptomyces phage Moab]|nr:hypothetical protein SEA_MOAB_253 [Streptomyces phage Moab]
MTVAELIRKLQTEVDQNAPIVISAPVVGRVTIDEEMVQDWTTEVVLFVQ